MPLTVVNAVSLTKNCVLNTASIRKILNTYSIKKADHGNHFIMDHYGSS